MLVVTGAAGLAGSHIIHQAVRAGFQTAGTLHHQRPVAGNTHAIFHTLDLQDQQATRRFIGSIRPSIVIHCAALTSVDRCETHPDEAMAVNALAARHAAAAAAAIEARFIHISTDSVFDGTQGHRDENDPVNPVNVYARSKLEGERLVLEAHPKALVIRTNFFGLHPQDARGLAGWILSRVREDQRLTGFTDVIFSPLWVGDLASLLLKLPETLSGVLHLAGAETVSKYAFAQRLTAAMGYDPRLVEPGLLIQTNLKAPRPADTSLCVSRATTLLGPLPDLEQALHNFRNASIRLAK
jgi:dTDP-4-dehydrorhamnose reductase